MNYLLIENQGEIDVNALVLMGGSTKRNDNSKVGFFGSGNKYSIALLLKHNVSFRIFSGEKEILISTTDVSFRDQHFKQILIDGVSTSLTTEMGPQWDIWMSVREFLSNSIDEGGSNIISSIESVEGKADVTRIYIEHAPEIQKVISNWDEYFSFDRLDVIAENNGKRIFPNICENQRKIFYRKGIRCYNDGKSLYHYDLPDFSINESRVIENIWSANRLVTKCLVGMATKEVAKNIMQNAFKNLGYMEQFLEYNGDTYDTTMSQGWLEAIGKRIIIHDDLSGFYKDKLDQPHYIVSKELCKKIKNSFPNVTVYGVGDDNEVFTKKVDMSKKMEYQLKKAIETLGDMKYFINFPIQVVEFSDQKWLGQAKDETILLSSKQFDKGIREIIITLIEENEHLLTGFHDETRSFQDHLFNKWFSAMEEQYGIFL